MFKLIRIWIIDEVFKNFSTHLIFFGIYTSAYYNEFGRKIVEDMEYIILFLILTVLLIKIN